MIGTMLSLRLHFTVLCLNVTLNSFVLLDCDFTGRSFWASKAVEEGKGFYYFVLQLFFVFVA